MPKKTVSRASFELPILQSGSSSASQPKSGRGRIRACVLIVVHLAILAHITHYWITGLSVSPIEPSEARYTIELGQVNAGAIFFVLAILSTMIFGRFFCGWGCHIVALQDLSGYLFRRIGFRPKPFRSRLLALVPFAVAYHMFFEATVKRLWRGVAHPGFSNHLLTDNFWLTFPGSVFSNVLTFVVCGGLIVYLLGNKGFCTYACPYGAFFSVSDRLAIGRIRVTDACHQCGQCTAHCTSNVQVHAEVRDFGMVVNPGCMKCMDCVSVCPNEALYFGLTERPGSLVKNKTLSISSKPLGQKKSYDFSWTEELSGLIVAAFTVYAVRGLYDFTPLLLSVAVGVMTAYLTIQFMRFFRRRDQRIQNIQLKRNGSITKTGWLTVVFLCAWFAFVIHSFLVQYHRYQGREYLSRVAATWPDLLTGSAQPLLTQEDHANLDRALKNYQFTDRVGLVDIVEVKLAQAVCNLAKGDAKTSEKYLRQAYACNPLAVREMIVDFLASQDRAEEIAEFY